MKKYRLGVVGCGDRGASMFRCASRFCPEIELAAACDTQRDMWFRRQDRSFAKNICMAEAMPSVAFYESFDEMLDKAQLDIVLVDTPASCHAEFCAKALQRNIHVFSDIPTVASLKEAEMLWNVAAKSSAMLMVGATTMGWGFVIALQDLVKRGLLGTPYALEAEYIHDCRYLWEATPWRKPTRPWHIPISYCTHSLGPLLSILDEDLDSVSAVTSGSHVSDLPYAHDYASALYKTPSGKVVRTTMSFINNCLFGNHSYRVYGSKGHFEHLSSRDAAHPARTTFNSTELLGASGITELPVGFSPFIGELRTRYRHLPLDEGHGGADGYLWIKFIEALDAGAAEAPVTLRQGLCMTLPGIYAKESIYRGGEKLAIHYPWQAEFQEDIRTFHPKWAIDPTLD